MASNKQLEIARKARDEAHHILSTWKAIIKWLERGEPAVLELAKGWMKSCPFEHQVRMVEVIGEPLEGPSNWHPGKHIPIR